ncbi:uncharacterized protein LOC132557283 [Ylistrum balloti]|uniref:uncharacterized protein LOC132550696 n=1 Tax=Ylistrum balloti TaxID=509963 RepID=UPI002905C6B4|nr:uncharacterized protein LOC132550696 [Ylistrum balloti]XP_060073598.1 uncharacterized protein LOC132553375 [Ylistrum balloti]XP_060077753.1 uncharacterized protein LOC132557283 [Ylistrum balloti]
MLREARTASVPVTEVRAANPVVPHREGAVSHDTSRQDGGPHVNSRERESSRPNDVNQHLIDIVTNLTESVATLQNCYQRLESRLESQTRRPVAAAAGSENQPVVDSSRPVPAVINSPSVQLVPTPLQAEYTLETAYKRFQEDSTLSQDVKVSETGSSGRPSSCSLPPNGVNYDDLSLHVDSLWDSALSQRTRASYQSGLNCLLTFILMQGTSFPANTLPAVDEDVLIRFVTHCQKSLHLKFDTIKLYLAGIRFHYIKNKLGDPTANTLRLSYILRAVKKTQVNTSVKRLPITCAILANMCNAIAQQGMFNPFVDLMLLCIYKTAFFGFLRCGEFTCNAVWDTNFIRICDISVLPDLSCFNLTLRSSKTDPFGKGVNISIFENSVFTPVSTMREYLNLRLSSGATLSSPLFLDHIHSSTPLMRHTFISYLKETLSRVGINNKSFNGHSFRIGASTSAAAAGVEDHVIQTLGRWSSDCFIRYIRINPATIRRAQQVMSS